MDALTTTVKILREMSLGIFYFVAAVLLLVAAPFVIMGKFMSGIVDSMVSTAKSYVSRPA